ncbi:hypothetical protein GB937_008878 [Aspergillus fischeri]|nr:hypothetical protein GB937_008878 [Aspergillus fischeri]
MTGEEGGGGGVGFIRSLSELGSPNRTPIIGAERETTCMAPTIYVTLKSESEDLNINEEDDGYKNELRDRTAFQRPSYKKT